MPLKWKVRKWRRKGTLGGTMPWEYEVGAPTSDAAAAVASANNVISDQADLRESSSNVNQISNCFCLVFFPFLICVYISLSILNFAKLDKRK